MSKCENKKMWKCDDGENVIMSKWEDKKIIIFRVLKFFIQLIHLF